MADDISIGTKNTTEQHKALQKCFTRLLVKGTFVKWHKTKSSTVFLEKYYKYLKAVLDSPSTLWVHVLHISGHSEVMLRSVCVFLCRSEQTIADCRISQHIDFRLFYVTTSIVTGLFVQQS